MPTADLLYNKKAIINPDNSKRGDNKCFQYAVLIDVYHKELNKNPGRIEPLSKFINRYNWCGINYPPDLTDFKGFQNKNKDLLLTTFFAWGQFKKSNNNTSYKASR